MLNENEVQDSQLRDGITIGTLLRFDYRITAGYDTQFLQVRNSLFFGDFVHVNVWTVKKST